MSSRDMAIMGHDLVCESSLMWSVLRVCGIVSHSHEHQSVVRVVSTPSLGARHLDILDYEILYSFAVLIILINYFGFNYFN